MSESKEINYYKLLQVDPEAEPTVIRYAYRYLAGKYHPENEETGDAELFREVTEAFRVLSDYTKRAAYDASIGLKNYQDFSPPETK